jgi:hypothetical protein
MFLLSRVALEVGSTLMALFLLMMMMMIVVLLLVTITPLARVTRWRRGL